MKIERMIKELQKLHEKYGNIEVTVTDGYNYSFYSGEYEILSFTDNGVTVVDIGIGGCLNE